MDRQSAVDAIMIRWSESIDLYCERLGPEWTAEPVNALSNLAFLLAAALLWRRAGRPRDADQRLLIALVAAVGLGSLVFHTVATRWAAVLDVAFIALFVLVYFDRFQVRVLARSPGSAHRGTALFVLAAAAWGAALGALPARPLNGSEIYLPPFALLAACAWTARRRAPAVAARLGAATALFAASFIARVADLALCPAWPLGTHFAWHLINAAVLGLCTAALLPPGRPPGSSHQGRDGDRRRDS